MIEIESVDNGAPSLTGTSTITVHIVDVNDNVPFFINLPAAIDWEENSVARDLIYTVSDIWQTYNRYHEGNKSFIQTLTIF